MKEEHTLKIRKLTAHLALVTVILFVITGYGMTQYQIIEKITFGLLSKSLSFKIHSYLIYPLIVFLLGHLYFAYNISNWFKKNEEA
jgi:hypothetical protein